VRQETAAQQSDPLPQRRTAEVSLFFICVHLWPLCNVIIDIEAPTPTHLALVQSAQPGRSSDRSRLAGFLTRCYPTVLHPIGRCVLGLTVWAIYLADRLLDVRHPASDLEPVRHRFYRRHRAFAQALLAAILCVDVLVTRLWLRPAIVDNGLLLTGGVVLYLATFPLTGWGATAWKKPMAAFLFTAGTFLIAWTGAGHPVDRSYGPPPRSARSASTIC
jgi:hypothetical protein